MLALYKLDYYYYNYAFLTFPCILLRQANVVEFRVT